MPLHDSLFTGDYSPGVQIEEGQWVAKEQLREKLMPRVGDRPLLDFVLNIVPNKVTSKGPVLRYRLSHLLEGVFAVPHTLHRQARNDRNYSPEQVCANDQFRLSQHFLFA